MMKRFIPCVAVVLLLGCVSDNRIRVHPVEGELQIGGKPASGAQLTFHRVGDRAAGEPIPFAVVGPDGKFRATTYAADDGAPEGEYRVSVVWPRPARSQSGDDNDDGTPPPDQLRGRFDSSAKTPLRATVTPGGTKLEPFRLD